jgi:uncharacterized protein YuzE
VLISYDAAADAVCICLTGQPLTPGRTAIQVGSRPNVDGFIALDWKDDRLVGIEILGASRRLRPDLLHGAEPLKGFWSGAVQA